MAHPCLHGGYLFVHPLLSQVHYELVMADSLRGFQGIDSGFLRSLMFDVPPLGREKRLHQSIEDHRSLTRQDLDSGSVSTAEELHEEGRAKTLGSIGLYLGRVDAPNSGFVRSLGLLVYCT